MNPNAPMNVEIDFKDLVFVIIKKMWLMILVGIVFASALFGFKYTASTNDANVLDISVRLEGESDVAYSQRVQNVNRAKDIVNSMDALNVQIENQRQYVTDSIMMQIDPMNEAVATAQIIITLDDSMTAGMDTALVSSYSQALKSGEYLAELAEELGTEQEYIKELITVSYVSASSVVVNSDEAYGSAAAVTVTIVGPSAEYSDKIMDCVLAELEVAYSELNSAMCPHTITLTDRQSFYMVDNYTRDLQYNAANRFETLQKQIELYDEALEELVPEIGVSSKDNVFAYFSFGDDSWVNNSPSLSGSIKFALVGFLFGAFIVALLVILNYVFGKRFSTQAQFFGRFSLVRRIGVAKPIHKRSGFSALIDKHTGDDNALTEESNNKLIAANIKNLTIGMNKVLVTGTAELARVENLFKSLDVKVEIKDSFFAKPESLETISEYDGVIIVEQRNYSNCRLISEELKLIANSKTKLIGAIVI